MPAARNTDPRTSHDAAASIPSQRIRESHAIILSLLRLYGPMTDETIYSMIESDVRYRDLFSPSGARTRRSELVGRGQVRDSGHRQRLASGRAAIVWMLA